MYTKSILIENEKENSPTNLFSTPQLRLMWYPLPASSLEHKVMMSHIAGGVARQRKAFNGGGGNVLHGS